MSDSAELRPAPATFTTAAIVFYLLLAVAGWFWLWLRDRSEQLNFGAVGSLGLVGSAAVGVGVGFALCGVLALLVRNVEVFASLERRLAELIGPLSETQMILVALASALGEEVFFRLAMQDAIGLWWTAAAFGLLHTGPAGTRIWSLLAVALGVVFGWMVELGCGLLSVTMAHALINQVSLRRMLVR